MAATKNPSIESIPEAPPLTASGNAIVLEAVNAMSGSISISDPELGQWLAESDELAANSPDFQKLPGIRVWIPK